MYSYFLDENWYVNVCLLLISKVTLCYVLIPFWLQMPPHCKKSLGVWHWHQCWFRTTRRNWIFSWPVGTNKDDCDEKFMNQHLMYLGNRHIETQNKAIVLYMSVRSASCHVELKDRLDLSVMRVVVKKGVTTVCYAMNGGIQVFKG